MVGMRVRVLACWAVVAIAVAGIAVARAMRSAGDTGASGTTVRLGLVANTLGWGNRVGGAQSLARQTGTRWLREEIDGASVIPARGERRWGATDRLFVAAAHRGLHVLPLLSGMPRWATSRDGALPIDARAYAAFVGAVVARYGPSGSFWRAHPTLDERLAPAWFELWNEPYFGRPSHSATTAQRYAALAAAAIRAGRAADPAARFLLAVDPSTSSDADLDARWLDGLEQAHPGLLAAANGVAVHPYGADGAASLRSLDHLRGVLAARGRARIPVWVTEVGWTTCNGSAQCLTERAQAANLRRLLTGVLQQPDRAAAVFYYHLRSWRVRAGDQLFGDYGLLRADLTRKPAWTVFRSFERGLSRTGAR
jgi:hypothetical protein